MTQPPTWGSGPTGQPPSGWQGQPGPQGQWGAQPPWPAPPAPKSGGPWKWIAAASALVAVIAVTAVVAVSCDRNGGNGGASNNASGASGGAKTGTSGAASDVASANDTGPVGIITEDPSCAAWTPITYTLSGAESNGWLKRDPSIPASAWTPEIRSQYEAVGKAWRTVADQTVPLAKMTPHRVMRELYGQTVAYMRAYADSIATYTPKDDGLALAGGTAANVINAVCAAISSGAAAARASLVPAPPAPSSVAPVGDLSNPQRMFDTPDPVCSDLGSTLDQLLQNPVFKSWLNTDPKVPVSNWSPEQESLTAAVAPVMISTADALEKLAATSTNPIVQDFILLGVQYRRTYVQTFPTYQPNDQYIYSTGQRAPGVLVGACQYATA